MQYKIILSALLLSLTASPLRAQQTAATAKPTASVVKSDSAAIQKPEIKAITPLLASNMANTGKGYNHVPLAGEKSYFGEKTEYVNEFVRKYMELHNRTLSTVQGNSATPFSVIDNVLEKKNLPKELKYLAVIESALNYNAVSRAGAVGPWQLMETTARMMGLSVSRKQDERRDLAKSTAAATKYLELLYGQLNDWLLVIAAYNSGPTPVQRAIALTGSHNFWDIKEYLPRETQGHVLAFIATASIFENLSKFIDLGSIPVDFKFNNKLKDKEEEVLAAAKSGSLPPATTGSTTTTGTTPVAATNTTTVKKNPFSDEELKNMTMVRITQPIYNELLAQELGIDKKLIARWNPDYEQYMFNKYPTPFYNLRLPKDKLETFLKRKEFLDKKSKMILMQMK
jgi:membrane-bound lytic murein transglycosylase D